MIELLKIVKGWQLCFLLVVKIHAGTIFVQTFNRHSLIIYCACVETVKNNEYILTALIHKYGFLKTTKVTTERYSRSSNKGYSRIEFFLNFSFFYD